MIVSLTGQIVRATGNQVVIDVNGVGYSVFVTPAHALSLVADKPATLHTSFIVREDAHTLYGFETAADRDVFEVLTSVTGVGPKSALGVLSAMSASEITDAIATEDDAAFRKVSGIGPKTAKHMVVALAGKLTAAPGSKKSTVRAVQDVPAQVLDALTSLGWREPAAKDAVQHVVEQHEATGQSADEVGVSAVLRAALAHLAGGSRS